MVPAPLQPLAGLSSPSLSYSRGGELLLFSEHLLESENGSLALSARGEGISVVFPLAPGPLGFLKGAKGNSLEGAYTLFMG